MSAVLDREDMVRLARQASDPGVQCPSRNGSFLCSRDRYHPGAHVCRASRPGEGMVGWGQSREEAIAALAEASR